MPALQVHRKTAVCKHARDFLLETEHHVGNIGRTTDPCILLLTTVPNGYAGQKGVHGGRLSLCTHTNPCIPTLTLCRPMQCVLTRGCRQACDGNLFPSITSSCPQSQFISMVQPSQ